MPGRSRNTGIEWCRTVATDQTKGNLSIFKHLQRSSSMSAWLRETCICTLPGGGQGGFFFLPSFIPFLLPRCGLSVRLSDKILLPVGAPGLPSRETSSSLHPRPPSWNMNCWGNRTPFLWVPSLVNNFIRV